MHFLFVEVSTVSLDWTVLKGQKETILCPVVFNEEIVAMFWLKLSQIDTENDKNHEIFQIPKILCRFFSKISVDFIGWNVEKGQKWKPVLSSRLFWTVFCNLFGDNVSNWLRKWQKPKIFRFSKFLRIIW